MSEAWTPHHKEGRIAPVQEKEHDRPASLDHPRAPRRQRGIPYFEKYAWLFMRFSGVVLVFLATHPDSPLREAADLIGITERAVQRILTELEEAGIVERERVGRRNRYTLNLDVPLRHPLESHRTIGDVLKLLRPRKG